MANIGTRPTVTDSKETVIEVHIFDTDRDLYNKEVRVYFVRRLRDEVKFENLEELTKQMANDAVDTKTVLAAGNLSLLG